MYTRLQWTVELQRRSEVEAFLLSTNNLYFGSKIRRKNVYTCVPQFDHVGCKGVFIRCTCVLMVFVTTKTINGQALASRINQYWIYMFIN